MSAATVTRGSQGEHLVNGIWQPWAWPGFDEFTKDVVGWYRASDGLIVSANGTFTDDNGKRRVHMTVCNFNKGHRGNRTSMLVENFHRRYTALPPTYDPRTDPTL